MNERDDLSNMKKTRIEYTKEIFYKLRITVRNIA